MIKRLNRIPAIRHDVSFIPVEYNNQRWLVIHDSMGYVTPNMAFPEEVNQLLAFFTGSYTWDKVAEFGIVDEVLQKFEAFYAELDKHAVLDSQGYYLRKQEINNQFLLASVREPICAGNTYPSDPATLAKALDESIVQIEPIQLTAVPKALFAPHIDFKVNIEVYAKAFASLKQIKPRHVYLIGTSHYSGLDENYDDKPFQFSSKHYQIPGRVLKNNVEKTTALFNELESYGATMYDASHRVEHSLELHCIWASHIWKHDFTITPILVGSFEDTLYMEGSVLENRAYQFSETLKNLITEDDFILISGDLSHVGLKFGDEFRANSFIGEVKRYDQSMLQAASEVNVHAMYSLIRKQLDAYRMCGFPPLMSVLASKPFRKGLTLNYDYWDEEEQGSGVTFGSVLFS